MNRKKLILYVSVFLMLAAYVTGGSSCANIVPPSGGPRDSLPPVLIKSDPGDSSKNFRGNRLVFTFDDYVEVQDIFNELIVSPVPVVNPIVEYRLNTVTVRLKDSLMPNTTYSFNFGNAIKDVNEGNVLRNFTYTISTGSYFDSLEVSGQVILAESGRVDTSMIVMLYSSTLDSAVVTDKPTYITKLNGRGNFRFKNLPPRTYRLYALKDDGSRRYLNDKQTFAFASEPVTPSKVSTPVTLYAYTASAAPVVPIVPPLSTTTAPNRNRGNAAAERRLKFTTSALGNSQDLLSPFEIFFEAPIRSFDSSKVTLFTDSSFIPVKEYHFRLDSNRLKIQMTTEWKENTLYHLILDKQFATDTTGKQLLKTDTVSFVTKKLSDYGRLKLKFRNLDLSRNPVLQFVINGSVISSVPMKGVDFASNIFAAGEYELRILFDDNKNGKWDPGSFFKDHRQPEIVKPIERRILVKPNWENEFEIDVK
jgi:hypothetical protein